MSKIAEKEVNKSASVPLQQAPSKIDFESLVKAHGFIKARQLLKRSTIEQHQDVVLKSEKTIHDSLHLNRAKATLKLSVTSGPEHPLSFTQKILAANPSIQALEKALNKEDPILAIELLKGIKLKEKVKSESDQHSHPKPYENHQFIQDHQTQYSLENRKWELLIPNSSLSDFPSSLSDTLHLQTAYLREVNASRNNFTRFNSHSSPQLSMYHFRYLTLLNLSFNNLSRLPDNFGTLNLLQTLLLSNNRLSKLPSSFNRLRQLEVLDLSGNSFSSLPVEFGSMHSLLDLDLSENLFSTFPYAVIKLESIQKLKFSRNACSHLGVMPPLLAWGDMFMPSTDPRSGQPIFINILTKEKVRHVELFNGKNIHKQADLLVFQSYYKSGFTTNINKSYNRRKMWLSVCGTPEWEPDTDPQNGQTYYRNNVSGESTWIMPMSLDTLGRLQATLIELTIKGNAIKSLPSSFTSLRNLVKFSFSRNRLMQLPEDIGLLVKLEYLELSGNELSILPVTLCDLPVLKTLIIDDNHLVRLPDRLGALPNLTTLNASVNRLASIPFSLGFSTSLTSLMVAENPLVDPPKAEFDRGNLEQIKWYLRNRQMIVDHGKPPEMTFHAISIQSEVLVLQPELQETINQKIQACAKEKHAFLNLQLLGLKSIPKQVLKMKNLRKLKLDFNDQLDLNTKQERNISNADMATTEGFALELQRLEYFSCRACKISTLPENIFIMKKLTFLSLEENRLESLPDGIVELENLTNLNLSKNRLFSLPQSFSYLTSLQTLSLESNYLEDLPPNFENISALKVLNLAKNRLNDVPMSITKLQALTVLNLEKNKLVNLPQSISHMLNIVDLRVGHNRLESLSETLFSSELGKTCRHFSCPENNLLELPTSIVLLHEKSVLDAEYNPLISPPAFLSSEGLAVLQNYLKLRMMRKQQLYQLMKAEDFELTLSSFTPIASEVLEDGTGFLTPADLQSFDQASNEFINGEYYLCPATAQEIVDRIVALRESRETEIYLIIIYTFLSVLKDIERNQKQLFTSANLITVYRPWGRDGENVACYAVSLPALLRESASNVFYPNGRPSLFNLVAAKLPPLSFPFTVDLLKDSIRLFISPYGPIANTENVTYTDCDCIDDVRGKPKRHEPCPKAAVVIAKSVYVEEEASRREVEEDEFMERFSSVEDDVRIWLVTDEGKRLLDKEVKRRKATLREEISLRDEMILSQQIKLRKSSDEVVSLGKRKELFEQGFGVGQHGFYSLQEAVIAIDKAQAETEKYLERIEVLKASNQELKKKLAVNYKTCCVEAASDLVQKYCVKAYHEAVVGFRRTAAANGWKRYWDGEDGCLFEDWQNKRSYSRSASASQMATANNSGGGEKSRGTDNSASSSRGGGGLKRTTSNSSVGSNTSAGSANTNTTTNKDKEGDELPPEFSWEDTKDMRIYDHPLFNRYRNLNGFNFTI